MKKRNNCKGLFNWGNGLNAVCDLDEYFFDVDEFVDEVRRLQGNVMPSNCLAYGMSIRSASSAGVSRNDTKEV